MTPKVASPEDHDQDHGRGLGAKTLPRPVGNAADTMASQIAAPYARCDLLRFEGSSPSCVQPTRNPLYVLMLPGSGSPGRGTVKPWPLPRRPS